MELVSRKKSRRDRRMHSKSSRMQGVKEIGWKKAGEWRDFSILWMEIIDVFQMVGKRMRKPEMIENV